MAISRMQEPRQLYGLGSLVKGVKKAVKGVAKGVKKFAKSDLGKAAMLYFGGNMLQGNAMFGNPFTGRITDFVASKGIPSVFSNAVEGYKNLEGPKKFLAQAGIGTAISGGLAALMNEDEETREMASQDVGALRKYLSSYYSNLGYNVDQIAENVERDTSEYGYANGGRIMRAYGSNKLVEQASGIEGLDINVNPKGVKELDLRETGGFIPPVGVKEKADDIPAMLSNNEFVFTADAVRAAGGGSVDKGAQLMYDTMKKLESKVV